MLLYFQLQLQVISFQNDVLRRLQFSRTPFKKALLLSKYTIKALTCFLYTASLQRHLSLEITFQSSSDVPRFRDRPFKKALLLGKYTIKAFKCCFYTTSLQHHLSSEITFQSSFDVPRFRDRPVQKARLLSNYVIKTFTCCFYTSSLQRHPSSEISFQNSSDISSFQDRPFKRHFCWANSSSSCSTVVIPKSHMISCYKFFSRSRSQRHFHLMTYFFLTTKPFISGKDVIIPGLTFSTSGKFSGDPNWSFRYLSASSCKFSLAVSLFAELFYEDKWSVMTSLPIIPMCACVLLIKSVVSGL